MKSPRIRLRQLMLVLAVVAVLIEVGGVGPRWRRYHRRARYEDWQTGQYLLTARQFEETAGQRRKEVTRTEDPGRKASLLREVEQAEYQADAFRQLAAWSERVGRNYRGAMSRPWAEAAPDPPFVHRHAAKPASMPPGSPSTPTRRGPSR